MLGYSFDIIYRKGSKNLLDDTLSKQPTDAIAQIFQMIGSSIISDLWPPVQMSWQQDPKLSQLCTDIQRSLASHSKYSWDGNHLKRKGKLVVGAQTDLQMELFQFFHNNAIGGHLGMSTTCHRIASWGF